MLNFQDLLFVQALSTEKILRNLLVNAVINNFISFMYLIFQSIQTHISIFPKNYLQAFKGSILKLFMKAELQTFLNCNRRAFVKFELEDFHESSALNFPSIITSMVKFVC